MSWIKWDWRPSDDEFLANSYAHTHDIKVLEKNTKFIDETKADPQADVAKPPRIAGRPNAPP